MALHKRRPSTGRVFHISAVILILVLQYSSKPKGSMIDTSGKTEHNNLGTTIAIYQNAPPTIQTLVLSDSNNYVNLPTQDINTTQTQPISLGGCCGIGHRMARNIPAMVYAMSNNRLVHVDWTDVPWNVLFNDTGQIRKGP